MARPFLSVVVPIYNEEENVDQLVERLTKVLARYDPPGSTDKVADESAPTGWEIIFAFDPSTDRTEELLRAHHERDPRLKIIKFSRKIGQPMATMAGLHRASGDACVVMDADLQDPPELIPDLVAKWQEGCDVVLTERRSRRGENPVRKLIAWLGYYVINRITSVGIRRNVGDFRLMSRRVVDALKQFPERNPYLRGLVALVGYQQTCLAYDRDPRTAGRTKYRPLTGDLRIGMNGLVCFSSFLLSLSSIMGLIIAGACFLFAVLQFVLKELGFYFASGVPTLTILVLFLGGVQLVAIGILGEYVGRIYDEVKGRPAYLVDEEIGFGERRNSEFRIQNSE